MAKSRYSPETKAAVLAALLQGQGAHEIATAFKLPEGTVRTWHARVKLSDGSASVSRVETQKREQIGELLIDYLHANLSTLRKQQEVFGDPAWLAKQNAADVAVLHGVMTDKAIRLLEALGGVGDVHA